MAEPNSDTPPAGEAGTTAAVPEQPKSGDPGAAEQPQTAPRSAQEEGTHVDEPLTEAEPPIAPESIQARETDNAISHTIPLDKTTVDKFADHVADGFSGLIQKFEAAHPGARPMLTVAVHTGGAILHAVDAPSTAQAEIATAGAQRLGQYILERFPGEISGDVAAVDVAIKLLERAFPRPASEAGLAAARK